MTWLLYPGDVQAKRTELAQATGGEVMAMVVRALSLLAAQLLQPSLMSCRAHSPGLRTAVAGTAHFVCATRWT